MINGEQSTPGLRVAVPTADDMRRLGVAIAAVLRGGDVVVLSGPLGAGKTTLAQGVGEGLGVNARVVSPTFTIARELQGRLHGGGPVRLVHVDAYRLGGRGYQPGQDAVGQLLDDLEALGLDEELEDPGEDVVVVMEWGDQMAAALAPQCLQAHIARPHVHAGEDPGDTLTSAGPRTVTLTAVGPLWSGRIDALRKVLAA